jgi:hypothetical protein
MASKVPWGALVWTGIAGALALRTFYQPARAVVANGFASRCPGKTGSDCERGVTLDSFVGVAPVYAVATGRVVDIKGRRNLIAVVIAAAHEPVLLGYAGDVRPQVAIGDEVSIGQQIGVAAQVRFTVTELRRTESGALASVDIEPTSWLAARGLRLSEKAHRAEATGPAWCEGGRHLVIPESVGLCNLALPRPTGLMLLPVSATMG